MFIIMTLFRITVKFSELQKIFDRILELHGRREVHCYVEMFMILC